MPSRFEPGGLNQIYSLRYGTLPIVRATGGLENTVRDYDERNGEGTGFKFKEFSAEALKQAVKRALDTYYTRPRHIKKLIRNAMEERFTWEDSARQYEKLYYKALEKPFS